MSKSFSSMRCPHCGHEKSAVRSNVCLGIVVRRRRECRNCKTRFNTYEAVGISEPTIYNHVITLVTKGVTV